MCRRLVTLAWNIEPHMQGIDLSEDCSTQPLQHNNEGDLVCIARGEALEMLQSTQLTPIGASCSGS
jgi:hypothetical protein